ncbi:MAG: stage 0 sporulation family protein [Defluviitaleaceae bacterium]|nr:stage 0 sporulation family protein [Defluviitaleaceae bacterium]
MNVIGVRFKNVGKIYYFDPCGVDVPCDAPVIVETVRGTEYGIATLDYREIDGEKIVQPLKKLIRLATSDDTVQEESNRKREKEAHEICQAKIKEHDLEMHLVDVEMTFDLNKIIFYFTADGRVDFRELVKDLASVFRTRIELRQIGVRDEAKILNGIGICGLTLCCATFLDEFQPVSIKMAKEQSLSLNPSKISGICGRLMCCLKYEEETYEFLNRNIPGAGDLVRTPDGDGEVISVNVLRQLARVAVRKRKGDDAAVSVYAIEEISILERRSSPEGE